MTNELLASGLELQRIIEAKKKLLTIVTEATEFSTPTIQVKCVGGSRNYVEAIPSELFHLTDIKVSIASEIQTEIDSLEQQFANLS